MFLFYVNTHFGVKKTIYDFKNVTYNPLTTRDDCIQFQYGNPGDNGGLLCDKWLAGRKHPANSRTDLQ